MALYATEEGIARRDDDCLAVLDLPHRDLGELLLDAEGLKRAAAARVVARLPSEAPLAVPFPHPGKVWITGLNYPSHAAEVGIEGTPREPLVFCCAGTAATGPGCPIVLPDVAPTAVDYEGEVAVVIGRHASSVPTDRAWEYVAGVTACNDVSARDVQRRALEGRGVDVALAKSFDSFKPLGPGLLTLDELDDRDDIAVQTHVNGELRQQDRTGNLMFSVAELVSFASRYTTLEPGDVISTGSPAGAGFITGAYLAPGDVVRIDVGDLLGPLTNRVVAPGGTAS